MLLWGVKNTTTGNFKCALCKIPLCVCADLMAHLKSYASKIHPMLSIISLQPFLLSPHLPHTYHVNIKILPVVILSRPDIGLFCWKASRRRDRWCGSFPYAADLVFHAFFHHTGQLSSVHFRDQRNVLSPQILEQVVNSKVITFSSIMFIMKDCSTASVL